jgi:hypothetical protein
MAMVIKIENETKDFQWGSFGQGVILWGLCGNEDLCILEYDYG